MKSHDHFAAFRYGNASLWEVIDLHPWLTRDLNPSLAPPLAAIFHGSMRVHFPGRNHPLLRKKIELQRECFNAKMLTLAQDRFPCGQIHAWYSCWVIERNHPVFITRNQKEGTWVQKIPKIESRIHHYQPCCQPYWIPVGLLDIPARCVNLPLHAPRLDWIYFSARRGRLLCDLQPD